MQSPCNLLRPPGLRFYMVSQWQGSLAFLMSISASAWHSPEDILALFDTFHDSIIGNLLIISKPLPLLPWMPLEKYISSPEKNLGRATLCLFLPTHQQPSVCLSTYWRNPQTTLQKQWTSPMKIQAKEQQEKPIQTKFLGARAYTDPQALSMKAKKFRQPHFRGTSPQHSAA